MTETMTEDVKVEETETRKDDGMMDGVRENAHRIWLAGLGALSAAEGAGVVVSYDYQAHRKCPIPNHVAATIRALEGWDADV